MKPGELERNLSRLVEVARTARERLAAIERELAELRHAMEKLAIQPVQRGEAEEPSPPAPAEPGHGGREQDAGGPAHGRRDPVARAEGDRPGREAGSE